MRKSALATIVFVCLTPLTVLAAPCDSNFVSKGNLITGTTYKTFADLPNVSVANAYEGALADIAKVPSWKVIAQDKAQGTIQAVQADSYAKGKTIPLNVNITAVGSGSIINMSYVTPPATLSPESAIKTQFCETIAAAGSYSGATSTNVANAGTATSAGAATNSPTSQGGGLSLSEPQKKQLIAQINPKIKDNQIKTMITEASPIMQKVLEMQACFYSQNSFGMYQSYGGQFVPLGDYVHPFIHHNMLECANVQRVKDWKVVAKNAFQFKVVYLAEDSGESKEYTYEMQKQPDGIWLFNWNRAY
jgi:hypothetical protein